MNSYYHGLHAISIVNRVHPRRCTTLQITDFIRFICWLVISIALGHIIFSFEILAFLKPIFTIQDLTPFPAHSSPFLPFLYQEEPMDKVGVYALREY
jgi:hypothetical protein